jgi:hypothetical protein
MAHGSLAELGQNLRKYVRDLSCFGTADHLRPPNSTFHEAHTEGRRILL